MAEKWTSPQLTVNGNQKKTPTVTAPVFRVFGPVRSAHSRLTVPLRMPASRIFRFWNPTRRCATFIWSGVRSRIPAWADAQYSDYSHPTGRRKPVAGFARIRIDCRPRAEFLRIQLQTCYNKTERSPTKGLVCNSPPEV